ncbi:glycosyltransferase [Leucobacter chromiiresistens]|nr:glycosyltransferase [Leucobacter chromiiresistens]
MREAFSNIGYEVIEVTGSHAERRALIRDVKGRISAGLSVDFVYSESSTQPTGFGEPVTRATSYLRDIAFLRFCQRADIPVGLFYRDIYWRFPLYDALVGRPMATLMRRFYRMDLRGYRRARLRLFLPSMRMAEWVPIVPQDRFYELPPGSDAIDLERPVQAESNRAMNLLYIGGLGSEYRMQETMRAVAGCSDVTLTICTRESDWEVVKSEYRSVLSPNTTVVHRSGDELRELYAASDICSLLMEPSTYREFAAPMKLYEYLGHGKPIIATEGSLVGEFVTANGLGWAIPYSADALRTLLNRLTARPEELEEVRERVRAARLEHTWEARAVQAARILLTGMRT